MPYELRINGRPFGAYETSEEATARARDAVRDLPPNTEVELIDTATGRAAEPGSSVNWRNDLAEKIGF